MSRVLVTGGAGFIGSHLVARLLSDGHAVRVLDNFATGRRMNLTAYQDDVDLVEGDIQSYERVSNAVRGCDEVYHQAALPSVPRSIQDPLTSNASNVGGTLNVLLAGRDGGVRRVVLASSSSVYGANPELPKNERLAPQPISPYAVAKLAGEGYARSFAAVYGLETVALRYFNVFGPNQDPQSQYAAVIPNFIAAMLDDRQPVIFGDGHQSRDFTYVNNVIDANVLAMHAPIDAGTVMNIACGERITLLDLVSSLSQLSGRVIKPTHEPARPGEVLHSQADISLATQTIGYEPRVGFQEGLGRTLDSIAEEHGRADAERVGLRL